MISAPKGFVNVLTLRWYLPRGLAGVAHRELQSFYGNAV